MTGSLWRTGLLVFLAVLAFSLPQAAMLPLIDRDEPRFAEATREMLQSGNYIVPMFNNEPRYAKPPLIYWCQALTFTLFGENAFAARLPSIFATAGTALLLFAWGVQLGSPCIGMIAALSYAFCLQTIQQGRVATADALLIFFMTLTAFAGWKLLVLARRADDQNISPGRCWNLWGTILALGFAGGFLAKGPEALLPIIPLLICVRSCGKRVLFSFVAILLLGLLIAAAWGIPALIETHGEFWRQSVSENIVNRATSGLQGHGASTFGWYLLGVPLYYTLLFWISALPWSPLLVTHRKKLFASWKRDPTDLYFLLNAGLIFLIFSLMATKLPHYTLPAFPFIALLFARRWIAAGLSPRLPTQLCGGIGIILVVLTLALVPVALAHDASPSPTGELVRQAQAEGMLSPDTQFALVDFQEPNVIWEMRRTVKGYGATISGSEVFPFLDQPGPRAVVISTAAWQQFHRPSSEYLPRSWKTYEARGLNTAKFFDFEKGTFVTLDLTLVVKK